MKQSEFRELIGHRTFSQLVQDALQKLKDSGSRITNLVVGGVWRTLTELAMQGIADIYNVLLEVIPQGYASYAKGKWLDFKVHEAGLERQAATRTLGKVTFIGDPEQPAVIPADTIIKTLPGPEGEELRYIVTERTERPAGISEVDVAVRAEFPGARYNVGANYIRKLVTHVPGIDDVINNEDWITQAGEDEESDTFLRERYFLRWHELSQGGTRQAYISWAKKVPGVRDVAVDDDFPRGQGTVDVIITGSEGPPSPALLGQVESYIAERKPNVANVIVRPPEEVPIDVAVTLIIPKDRGDLDRILSLGQSIAWSFFVQNELDMSPLGIGEDFIKARLIGALMEVEDVLNVYLSAPIDDVHIETYQILVPGEIQVEVTREE